jgi:hypothetical protein
MRALTLIIGIIITVNTYSQVNKFRGMELYTDTTSYVVDNQRSLGDDNIASFGVYKEYNSDEMFTKKDFDVVLKELDRILVLNGRTLDSFDGINEESTVLINLTLNKLYDAYVYGRLNTHLSYKYEVNGYELFFTIDNIGTSKHINILFGSKKDWDSFMVDYND